MASPQHHRARKRFGQNFLVDTNVIERIISCIDPAPSDHVIEIGPGLGALTRPLLTILDRLDAVELDRDVIPELKKIDQFEKLHIHNADVLKFDFTAFRRLNFNDDKLRLVGNLPYNISTPILFHLVEHIGVVQDMHFMLQKEVVERIDAKTGSRDYSRLSVMMQLFFNVKPLFTVGPHCFRPAPKVESAVLRLTPRPEFQISPQELNGFSALVKQAFSQRRKTLRNTLRGLRDPEQMMAAGIEPGMRAQELSIDDYVRLYRLH